MSKKELGSNAQAFCDHICAGLEAGGFNPKDYLMSIVADDVTKEVGFLIGQVPLSEMCEEHMLKTSEAIVCYEDRIAWHFEENTACMSVSERQPASMCAVLFLGAILTGKTVPAQILQECEDE
tara:strand:+ start:411 stop:779 length:369 start_codon:yes stop_codon:yes gene_type:complete